MKLEFLASDDPRWLELLREVPHQFYSWPGYAELCASHEGGQAEAVLVTKGEDYLFLPYVLHTVAVHYGALSRSRREFRSPYGYAGPILRTTDPCFLRAAIDRLSQAMRDRGIVSGFVRLDPLVSYPQELSQLGTLTFQGYTVSVDLDVSEATLHSQIRRQVRNDIDRAKAAGLGVRTYLRDRPWNDFCDIYFETMERVGARPEYFYARNHFAALEELLGDTLHVAVACQTGKPLAAGLFVESCGVMQHHLHGTRTIGLPLRASKLLTYHMILTAKSRGNRLFHLGGGKGASSDSLFQFKTAFSRARHPYFTWRLQFRPREERRLFHAAAGRISQDQRLPEFRSSEACR